MAVVIGIDFGNESSYVGVARGGGIETVDNDYSLRATPSTVAFKEKQRILGVAAKNQLVTNIKNTVWGFKRFLGRTFQDPYVQKELTRLPFKLVEHPQSRGVGVEVWYMDQAHVFSMEQVTAMLFTKLKETTEHALKTKVADCVVSVPSYFTDVERRALRAAAETAGLKVLRLLNDSAATSLSYGIYKQDLPDPSSEEKPRNVVFVDCGHSALQVWVCAFYKGQLKILASTADPYLGGRDFDKVLTDHFCAEFRQKYKIDVESNHRAYVRLLTEVEKLKKQMSANATKLPLNIECLMNDKDVTSSFCRADFEALAIPLFQRVEATMKECLQYSNLKMDEIHSVEIVGGSSRLPAIKQLIEKIFGKAPSTTLNQDEAVARGCALQCAILSPAYKVRDFKITDVQPYPIRILWDESLQDDGYLDVFPLYHPVPYSRVLTFYKQSDFKFKALYASPTPYPCSEIASYHIGDIKPAEAGDSVKIKIKARVNIDGIFSICSVTRYDKVIEEMMEMEEPRDAGSGEQAMEQQETPTVNGDVPNDQSQQEHKGSPKPNDTGANGQNTDMDVEQPVSQSESNADTQTSEEKKKKGPLFKPTEIPFESEGPGLTYRDIEWMAEDECKMIVEDRREKERVDAKNALEEYVYVLRDKLDGELAEFVQENEKSQLLQELSFLENWLYEEGSDETRHVYAERLEKIHKSADPVFGRQREKFEKERLEREKREQEERERIEKEKQEQEKLQQQQNPQPDGQTPQQPEGSTNEAMSTEDL